MPSLRDILTLLGRPALWGTVHRARRAGLPTLLDYQRLSVLWAAAELAHDVPGDVIECGVYRGGSAAILATAIRRTMKALHLCDSFRGLPAATEQDNYHKEGDFGDAHAQAVAQGLLRFGASAILHEGWFSETLPMLSGCTFSLLHLDADLYKSIRECLSFCYPRMSRGGVMVFDDYGSPTCQGARVAVDEFFEDKPENPEPLAHPQWGVRIGHDPGHLREAVLARALWYYPVVPGSWRILRFAKKEGGEYLS